MIEHPWPDPTEDEPDRVLKIKVKLTGPLDVFDATCPDYAHAFDWDTTSQKARAHIAGYVLRGVGSASDIETRLAGGKGTAGIQRVTGGRHRCLYVRIASQIREAIGSTPLKLRSARKEISDAMASTAIIISNIRHRRDPAAEGREYAKACSDRAITPAELADEIGESLSHVKSRIRLAESGQRAKEEKPRAAKRPARKMIEKLYDALKADSDTPKESLELIEYCLTGRMSKTVKKFLE